MGCSELEKLLGVSRLTTPLAEAKAIAVTFGKSNGFVHAGQVQTEVRNLGFELGNAAGNIFTPKKNWTKYGTIANPVPSARGRKVTVWKYIGEGAPSTAAIPAGTIPAANVSQVVPGLNVGAAEVTSVVIHTPRVTSGSTPQNTQVGTKIEIRDELRAKLTQNGKRPFFGTVTEVISVGNPRWPLRIDFGNGVSGLVDYSEVVVVS